MRACNGCGGDLDQVRPQLRRDAMYCNRTCAKDAKRTEAAVLAAEGVDDPSAPFRFWEAVKARRVRRTPLTGPLRARHQT